jgi:hypothetical protein
MLFRLMRKYSHIAVIFVQELLVPQVQQVQQVRLVQPDPQVPQPDQQEQPVQLEAQVRPLFKQLAV